MNKKKKKILNVAELTGEQRSVWPSCLSHIIQVKKKQKKKNKKTSDDILKTLFLFSQKMGS